MYKYQQDPKPKPAPEDPTPEELHQLRQEWREEIEAMNRTAGLITLIFLIAIAAGLLIAAAIVAGVTT